MLAILVWKKNLGVQINEEDISVSHRLPQNKHNVDKPPIIIAKFVRRDTKENLYRARSKLRHITTQDLGFQGDNKIYIQESLTQKNKELFRKALKLKKSRDINSSGPIQEEFIFARMRAPRAPSYMSNPQTIWKNFNRADK